MADEDHGDAVGGELRHDRQQAVGLGMGERGRRLVHEDEPRIADQRPADGDDLALGDRQRVERRVEIERDAEPGKHPFGLRPHLAPPDQPRAGAEDVAEGDVLGDGHLRKQREVLPDDVMPRAARGDRRHRFDPPAEIVHLGAGVGRVDAGDDLDQRALARAVLAGEAVHFAGQHFEARRPVGRATPPNDFEMCAKRSAGTMAPASRAASLAASSTPLPPGAAARLYSRFVWLARITFGSTSTSVRSLSIITSNRTNNAPS